MEEEGYVGWEVFEERGLWGDAGVEVWGSSLAGGMNPPALDCAGQIPPPLPLTT